MVLGGEPPRTDKFLFFQEPREPAGPAAVAAQQPGPRDPSSTTCTSSSKSRASPLAPRPSPHSNQVQETPPAPPVLYDVHAVVMGALPDDEPPTRLDARQARLVLWACVLKHYPTKKRSHITDTPSRF
eukprot:PhM_4_TR2048/c0_g3_i4/m.95527